MGRYFLNSAIVTSLNVVGMVISCTLAGWGFSRANFWGRNFLFLLVLSTMMIPGQVTLIPLYLIFSRLHWVNTFLPLVVPAFFAAAPYNVFLVRQFFLSLPHELDEAAVIDGCGPVRVFWSIGLPLVRPAVVTVAVFTTVFTWSDFFQPLIYLSSNKLFTVALGLTAYQAEGFVYWNYLMAASTVAVLPVLLVFLFFQRYFVKGLAATGLKE
jgi:multiple sugar transport system permease protein